MHVTTADKRATFRKMHESGCFILPNPVDVGGAKALQQRSDANAAALDRIVQEREWLGHLATDPASRSTTSS